MSVKVRKAIFPTGGSGTRFLPATKAIPKEILPVFDKPLVQWAVEEAKAAGIEEFLFIESKGKHVIGDHFDNHFELEYKLLESNKHAVYQSIKQSVPSLGTMFSVRQQVALGLGHAVACAKNFINNEPFAVLLPDELLLPKVEGQSCLRKMIETFEAHNGDAIVMAAEEVDLSQVHKYGVFNIKSREGNLITASGVMEKPRTEEAPSNIVSIGRYVLPSSVIEVLETLPPSINNEVQLTDAIDLLTKKEGKTLLAYLTNDNSYRFDCGNPVGLLKASLAVAKLRGIEI